MVAVVIWLCGLSMSQAGTLGREEIKQFFPDALKIGEKLSEVPVWPIYKLDGWIEDEVGWVFESADIAPIPGFAGVSPNLLVALDKEGRFMDVRVISQEEPVFQDGLGPQPLIDFVAQYAGLNLLDNIKIRPRGGSARGNSVYLDGVTKATASVKIINESILAAALRVARAKLGYAAQESLVSAHRVRQDHFEDHTVESLRSSGLVFDLLLDQSKIEGSFVGTAAALGHPAQDGVYMELELAYLNAPTIGRNLLGESGWQAMQQQLPSGFHAFWVEVKGGSNPFIGDFIRGAVFEGFEIRQNGLPFSLRDLDIFLPADSPASSEPPQAAIFGVASATGFDPGAPWNFVVRVDRKVGHLVPELITREFAFKYTLPSRFFEEADTESSAAWRSVWRERQMDLWVIGVYLILLLSALAWPNWLTRSSRRLLWIRTAALLFILTYLGWVAQGQLSLVHFLALLEQLSKAVIGSDWTLSFYLYDPVTLVILLVTLVTLLIWGRGTFCGWLCPFGALQELLAMGAEKLGLRRLQLPAPIEPAARKLPLVILAGLAIGTAGGFSWTDGAIEIEPFKTAITLGFARTPLPVVYAGALLVFGLWCYKAFCRYLCPLGALLELGGRMRLWNWLARRPECGSPCQACRRFCAYDAIRTDGSIRYNACFQCLDCVVIFNDPTTCPPLRRLARGLARTAPRPASAANPHPPGGHGLQGESP